MVPSSMSRDTSSTACTPPKDRLTLVSCSSALTGSPACPPARRDDGEAAPAADSLGPEDDDEDLDDAADDVSVSGKLSPDLPPPAQDDPAHNRPTHFRPPPNHRAHHD